MPGIKIKMPMIAGSDIAGEIAELGAYVDWWNVGDREVRHAARADDRRGRDP